MAIAALIPRLRRLAAEQPETCTPYQPGPTVQRIIMAEIRLRRTQIAKINNVTTPTPTAANRIRSPSALCHANARPWMCQASTFAGSSTANNGDRLNAQSTDIETPICQAVTLQCHITVRGS